jgi:hypothetical protein
MAVNEKEEALLKEEEIKPGLEVRVFIDPEWADAEVVSIIGDEVLVDGHDFRGLYPISKLRKKQPSC